ncbi:MAG: AmmeMemoRadiSam system radical SAM enzyme [Lachnospiraceae bacterium]|nr:AmmeMemoRadiSam system radical SAM enzyme [Lachnospiraceae bacterium]
MPECKVCFHHCRLNEGQLGLCLARRGTDTGVVCDNYGKLTALALDPIEKKPLYHFHPGSFILSVGSYGCNLRCPFCQNSDISYSDTSRMMAEDEESSRHTRYMAPDELALLALQEKTRGNIGVAFTYNEPLVGYEYVRDAAREVKGKGMHTVLVTNGTATREVEDELLPVIDAMNVDLKAFNDDFYDNLIHGSRQMTMDFIARAAEYGCHVEATCLIIPGENDSPQEMESLASWLKEVGAKCGTDIPLHITRFFPRFNMTDRAPTDVGLIYDLCEVAHRHLKYVHAGNV